LACHRWILKVDDGESPISSPLGNIDEIGRLIGRRSTAHRLPTPETFVPATALECSCIQAIQNSGAVTTVARNRIDFLASWTSSGFGQRSNAQLFLLDRS